MPKLRSRDVGKPPVSPQILMPTEVDKTPSANPQTEMRSGKETRNIMAPSSSNTGSVVRRSARLNSRLSDVTWQQDNGFDPEPSFSAGPMVNNPSVDKEKAGSVNRARANGNDRGREKGKRNRVARTPDGRHLSVRGRRKRKMNDGTSRKSEFSENESDEDDEIVANLEGRPSNEAVPQIVNARELEAAIMANNLEGQDNLVDKESRGSLSRGQGSSRGKCNGKRKLSEIAVIANTDAEETRAIEGGKMGLRSRVDRGRKEKEHGNSNEGMAQELKFFDDELEKFDGIGLKSEGSLANGEIPAIANPVEAEAGTMSNNLEGQDASVDEEITGSLSRGRGSGSGRGLEKGKVKLKLFGIPIIDISDAEDTCTVDGGNLDGRGQESQGRKGKGKQKSNDDTGANSEGTKANKENPAIIDAVEAEASDLQMKFSESNEVPSTVQNAVAGNVQRNGIDINGGSRSQIQNYNRATARERFLAIARRRASHFATFNPENGESSRQRTQTNVAEGNDEEKRDWPGPFSTARRLVEERATALAARQEKLSGSGISASVIEWSPSREKDFVSRLSVPPSLYDLCLRLLCEHVEHIESLEVLPDAAKKKICLALCASRKMTPRVLGLFITGSPTEICVPDCSLVPEEDLTKLIAQCSTSNLEVLQLGMCGRGLSERLLLATFASPSVGLPCLTTLALKGAYRLSDIGLSTLVRSAPLLRSVDLSRCSFLSEAGIHTLADSLAPLLKELHLEECHQLEALKILPALKKMQNLEILSVAGIPSVTDAFTSELLAHLGCNLKELSLADCGKLTDCSLEAIGAVCCGLNSLTLDNLYLLTDTALVHLANGCRSLQTLSLRRCLFSDEAVAAFIGASGNCLSDLSLNSVKKIADHTVFALASNSYMTLSSLDVSFCRNLTDEALGLLADSCSVLHKLILFGCTQVTEKFLKGHSNMLLKVIGVN